MMYSLILKTAQLRLQQARFSQCCVMQTFKQAQTSNTSLQSALEPRKQKPETSFCSVRLNSLQHVLRKSISIENTLRNKGNHDRKDHAAGQVSVHRRQGDPALSTAQKVKEAGKDFTYLIVVLVGIGVTGGLLYVVFKELFSSSSPSKIYGDALEKCRAHPEVIGVFGEPIKGYGETTRRGRRQHVSHVEYMKDGLKHMRLKFYIEGSEPRIQGTVHSEVKENPETGKYEFRFIFVDIDTYPRRTVVIEDNR